MVDVAALKTRLGRVGIWSIELRFGDPDAAVAAVPELEELGFGAIWVPGGHGGDLTGDMGRLVDAGSKIVVASGILNVWRHEPVEIGVWFTGLSADKQARVLLGLGVSHAPAIGDAWGKPLSVMNRYVTGLEEQGVPAASLCVAALGPKMLALAGERTAGAHPYLITPEHSAQARAILGPDALLAPEQGVILETDPGKARELGRKALEQYGKLPNYANNWQRLGFSEDEIANAGDRLVDALFAWGPIERIVDRVKAHHDAGADHVCVQAITGQGVSVAAGLAAWRELAAALL